MTSNVLLQLLHIPNIVYPLFKASNKTRRKADEWDIEPLEFRCDIEMLNQRGCCSSLVNGDLHFKRLRLKQFLETQRHARHMRDGSAILGNRLEQNMFIKRERELIEIKAFEIPGPGILKRTVYVVPGNCRSLAAQCRSIIYFSSVIDIVARINGVESVPRGDKGFNISRRLQMVGIRPPGFPPSGLKCSPHRIIQHILRRAPCARIFTHGLLRENRSNSRSLYRLDVAESSHTQAITKSRGCP